MMGASQNDASEVAKFILCFTMATSTLPNKIHPDLVLERSKASFDVPKMTTMLVGGPEEQSKRSRLHSLLQSHPKLGNKQIKYFLGRTALFERGLEVVRCLYDLKSQHNLNDDEFESLFYLFGEDLPIQLQVMVFLPCLKALASEEQLAKWLPLAQRYEMIGSYAQTELGHGSNVSGLLTEAKYDPASHEIIIHTPCLEATKWWIGQLGKCSNHTVVFAQLLMPTTTGYKNYGPHPFLVQVRKYEDHTVLPGIKVGDIGPKMGFAALDNGFIAFDHVRIPASNMLSRYSKINPETKSYEAPTNSKLLYGSMLAVRTGIVGASSLSMQRASTVAIRYSAVRRQFAEPGSDYGAPEKQILDYLSQQHRVLPVLAGTYATHFVGRWMFKLFAAMNADFAKGDMSLLPVMHATSSGLKSLITSIASEGIETSRMACGGHGYSLFSSLPGMYSTYVHLATAEGENLLLNQQTVKQLLKLLQYANTPGGEREFHPQDPSRYLLYHKIAEISNSKSKVTKTTDWLSSEHFLGAIEHRATRLVALVAKNLQEAMATGTMTATEAWNQQLIEVNMASRAHCYAIIARVFVLEISQLKHSGEVSPQEIAVLKQLSNLFALNAIEKDLGQFTEDQFISAQQASFLREALKLSLAAVRTQAVALVDAFDISDYSLTSALGRKDGRVYETMFDWAQNWEPLNKDATNPAFIQHIQPLIHKNRSKL